MQRFRDALRAETERIENARIVETTGFALTAELSPNVGHGHHWFGIAEGDFLVGNALAERLEDLLGS